MRYHSWEDPFQRGPKEPGLLKYADSTSGDSEIDGAMYEIERVVNHHDTHRSREYLICWKGYTAKEDTWKPSRELKHTLVLVKDYEIRLQTQQRLKGRLEAPKGHPDRLRKQAPPASVAPEAPKRRPGRPRKNAAPSPTSL